MLMLMMTPDKVVMVDWTHAAAALRKGFQESKEKVAGILY